MKIAYIDPFLGLTFKEIEGDFQKDVFSNVTQEELKSWIRDYLTEKKN